jgi:hypothetical protein
MITYAQVSRFCTHAALFSLICLTVFSAQVRADELQISGVYPHLTTYGIYSEDGAHTKKGHDECGIGAIVPWAGKLWMVNYAPHQPRGSEHKLYSVDENLNLTIHPESVGGTPAARMIHRESNQLLIAHYLIDASGKVRVISPKVMPGRLTAIARHLTDPANMVYYCDMEGMLYEANVHTLEVTKLYHKPVPGWHAKGGYTSQGRLVWANNGEHAAGNYKDLVVGGAAQNADEIGALAEWDGKDWRIIERRQFCDVTGPGGICGAPDDKSPLWAIGWDLRSLRLKLLDGGKWSTFLLPKATHNNDPKHGWYTEWPRIREIGEGRLVMDMHGMFFDFPKTFSAANTAGLRPIASHLRYIPDFCNWNGRLVIASDETSIQGNPMAGQPQSNLWFGEFEDLKTWGPASGYGGPWVGDKIKAGVASDPFLIHGFDRRVLHLALGGEVSRRLLGQHLRATDQLEITSMPTLLAGLARVTVHRGNYHRPAPGYSFRVTRPVTVYLAVDVRGDPNPGEEWTKTEMAVHWGGHYRDSVYEREFEAGIVEIPGNDTEHKPGDFGMPHTAFVACEAEGLEIEASRLAKVTLPPSGDEPNLLETGPVNFALEVGTGAGFFWSYATIEVPEEGYVSHILPEDLDAQWIRIRADKACIATAYFHLTDKDSASADEQLFAGLAEADSTDVLAAQVYAAKQNRNLRVIADGDRFFEVGKETFEFQPAEADEKLVDLLEVEPEFTVDEASVVLSTRKGRLRLPKGNSAYDQPFASGWPRVSREVESERHLANIHGTFYEVPLIINGVPPAFELMRPVASHSKQITDFCTWNGLLVLAGVRLDAKSDGHVFTDGENDAALWFGGIDDLWKLGKPVGQGGPWKDSAVKAGQPSDPYLMTGYDRKTLTLQADRDVMVTIEVDVDHQSGCRNYRTVSLTAGEAWNYEFPASFSAHWVRFKADADCVATAWLIYE